MGYSHSQKHRVDSNAADLVKLFLKLGGLWVPYASKPFDGWAWHAKWEGAGYVPVEIKNPNQKGHADEYTPRQVKVMNVLRVAGATWLTWRTDEDVYACLGASKAA